MTEKQRTISKPVSVTGKGLHTGIDATLTFYPAPENSGYQFRRIDLKDKPIVKAQVENVVDTSRGTAIEENGVRINTVEHVLAALSGLQIDNALIELNGPETPIVDGSSKAFVEALIEAGITEQNAERYYYHIREKIEFKNPEKGIEIVVYPDDKFSVNVLIDYDSKVLTNQYATLDSLEEFKDNISCCRTFVFLHELEQLVKHNLIKGGDMKNAIVIIDKAISQDELDKLASLFNKPKVQVKPQGILNNLELYYPNEPARHKLLDFIGDLALIGCPIKGRIVAKKPGHLSNTEFAKIIRKFVKKDKNKPHVPNYDPNKEPIMDIIKIKKMLPHRYPFLLVDKIIEMTDTTVVGIKNVTNNENFFMGHFPAEPVMPGVLIIEAMAQVGGLLVLSGVPDPENYSTYFLKINNVRFKDKVVPGDTLILKLELVDAVRRGVCTVKATAFVGDTIVTEAELMAQIVKNKSNS
ncbi:MAG: UDP-3-O-[3-hydroxymyristoyl] N-acetylglucosamine deacetylase [Bacteroidetes bacterium RIFOXYA12_FULL_35_11]|nr:MAG: UDP-3-O-[3-hydroxymyristoyl] N-acetylglucosamine deacetylase [Bacteroidetes bacterium GWF2_35_48]OFY73703.1 MAG: UDP-3-O-[3-hydroxymyristoyl] N-acetylglucosamine deacetylase [Bacteroidetes bacterium RIFOXYA12_FULL_35_11]OFY92791.1 MAG: UDP-3-O-[3-hydroxymyristoyl] N-acetylglucosamine deacetylase [Bacteroidetes bacterium RIFOXYC12_FULL_35_7]OFY96660.1 MAG: UDP-3-O-[3-hydroxymyristoyl] N-acetylglucosamine deacetylase [Bacteroidetes bacterium RIFOXYB2_FULL_35_7]HBX52897.1 UDP-3-O-[3-hydrox